MNKITSLITGFFTVYLINERGLSTNTIKSYRDTFILYFRFLECKKNIRFNKIDISIFSFENVIDFLDYLETELHCSINTRNQRLAALKSFSSYATRKFPEYINDFNQILNINGGTGIVDINNQGTLSGISIVVLNNETYYYPPNTNINFI